MDKTKLRDGEPCDHPGCLSHITHPCEGCGRIAGHYAILGTDRGIKLVVATRCKGHDILPRMKQHPFSLD